MSVTVTKAFKGRPDKETKVREIAVGEEIEGDLAEVAVKEGWAKRGGAAEAPKGKSKAPAPAAADAGGEAT